MYDICIIGAGLSGCFIAHELSKYNVNVLILDGENDVANQTSMANSAIIHTGYDPEDGTLKAQLNVEGAKLYPSICKELKVGYVPCGAYVVSVNEEENRTLKNLYDRAVQRGIEVSLLSGDEARIQEVNLQDHIQMVMEVPQTAVIYPWEVCIALMEEAVLNGVTLSLNDKVTAISHDGDFTLTTTKGRYSAHMVINAAGCGCEKIASMLEDSPYTITPKKGEYFVLSKQASDFVHRIIYPAPTKLGKGVLAVPTTHGNILLGPTSIPCAQDDTSTTKEGMELVREQLTKTLKNIPYQEIIRSYSGLRPSGNDNDFYIKESIHYKNFIHVACIDSPGLASAPAIARYVMDEMIRNSFNLQKKTNYQKRKAPIIMKNLNVEERNQYIKKHPSYGEIVCRCEGISKGEILDAIHQPCGARTIKGIKKRVRPGMGKCQGGFCEPMIAKILAEELHIPLKKVLYDQLNTPLGSTVKGETL